MQLEVWPHARQVVLGGFRRATRTLLTSRAGPLAEDRKAAVALDSDSDESEPGPSRPRCTAAGFLRSLFILFTWRTTHP